MREEWRANMLAAEEEGKDERWPKEDKVEEAAADE